MTYFIRKDRPKLCDVFSVCYSVDGRKLMYSMMMVYDGDQERYARISGHGFRILAEAMQADLPYKIKCPALLICGEKDHAGSCIRYNKAWHKKTGIPIEGTGYHGMYYRMNLLEDFDTYVTLD